MVASAAPGGVTISALPDGRTQVEVLDAGRPVSRLEIVPCHIRVGAAVLRMDGIGDVHTEPGYRRRGLARRLLESTVEHLRGRDGALSMLYGIPDFYHRFGYATAGPDHRLHLERLDGAADLPAGWAARPIFPGDLSAVRRLYERETAESSGAAVRAEGGWVWSRLLGEASGPVPEGDGGGGCRVLVGPDGAVGAYVWRGQGFWYADRVQRQQPDDLVLAEAVAGDRGAAEAALALCRRWAHEVAAARGRPVRRVTIGLAPEGHFATAATHQYAVFEQHHEAGGGSMARVLDAGRLVAALRPELTRRAVAAGSPSPSSLVCETEEGEARIGLGPPGADPGGAELRVRLPQTALARLALGAFPPQDVLDGLDPPPGPRERYLLAALFPARHPHMYWPDRY